MPVHQNCNVITVLGGKGGVGKSVFAANLACAYMQEMRTRVLLIDLDAKSCGDQNILTGLRPKKTVAEVANFAGVINPQTVDTVVTAHSSGLAFIGAVQSPDQTLIAPAQNFKKQLSILSQFFGAIVIDLGCDFGELQLAALEETTAILAVTTPEVLAVNQTKKVIQDLMAGSMPGEFFQIVLNNAGRAALDARLISQTLNRPVIGVIPEDDATVYASIQRQTPFVLSTPNLPVAAAYYDIIRKLSGGILQKLKSLSRPAAIQSTKPNAQAPSLTAIPGANKISATSTPSSSGRRGGLRELTPEIQLKMQTHAALLKEMDLKKDMGSIKGDPAKEAELKAKTQKLISQIVDRLAPNLSRDERSTVIRQVLDEALGLGALEELLADPTVTEIMVNGCDRIYVEKSGKLQLSNVTFTSNEQLKNIIERIVIPLGRQINDSSPYVDARLADGSRVNAVIPPLAIDGPSVTIRKFPSKRMTIDEYVNNKGAMSKPMLEFLKICVEQGINVIISGGTGSGKTTLLNVLSSFIPSTERIVTIEDAAELQLQQDHVVRLETKPKSMEGTGEVTIRDLVKNSLRMRPNRIIVGECRDGAALDMLSAMNTGHNGSMTTVHSNNPRECIGRLETLCLMAGMDLPAKAIREQIASAVQLIIQISRFRDGSRRVTSITEVIGMQGDVVTLAEIFKFREEGQDKNRKIYGQFLANLTPSFLTEFENRGVSFPPNIFTTSQSIGSPTTSASAPASTPATPSSPAVPRPVAAVPKPTAPVPPTPPIPSATTPKKTGTNGGNT